jgi:hypothetical protein
MTGSRTIPLDVFVHAVSPLDAGQAAELTRIGIASRPGERIFTAAVASDVVGKLSELPWIDHISLAKKRRPL